MWVWIRRMDPNKRAFELLACVWVLLYGWRIIVPLLLHRHKQTNGRKNIVFVLVNVRKLLKVNWAFKVWGDIHSKHFAVFIFWMALVKSLFRCDHSNTNLNFSLFCFLLSVESDTIYVALYPKLRVSWPTAIFPCKNLYF